MAPIPTSAIVTWSNNLIACWVTSSAIRISRAASVASTPETGKIDRISIYQLCHARGQACGLRFNRWVADPAQNLNNLHTRFAL